MSYRSTSPPQRQLYQQPNQGAIGRQQSRLASISSTTSVHGGGGGGGGATNSVAGTPSRRQNKRSSVTVFWPDAEPHQGSLPPSRLSSAGGSRPSGHISGIATSPVATSGGGHASAASGASPMGVMMTMAHPAPTAFPLTNTHGSTNSNGVAGIPIPTAPKRPSISNSAFSAAAASATAAAAAAAAATATGRRTRTTSLDNTAAPPAASTLDTTTTTTTPPQDGGWREAGERDSGSPPQNSFSGHGLTQQPPSWLTSPVFATVEPLPRRESAPQDNAARPPLAHPAPSQRQQQLAMQHQQQQQQQQKAAPPAQQSYNTNGLCEAIVVGVRHGAGQAGFPLSTTPSPDSANGFFTTEPPLPLGSIPQPPLSSLLATQTTLSGGGGGLMIRNSSNFYPPATSSSLVRPGSGRYTGPSLPQYDVNNNNNHPLNNASMDGAPQLAEKRTSNPFTSYSNDLCAGDMGSAAAVGGVNATLTMANTAPLPSDEYMNTTGELALYQQQQQLLQMQQQENQRVSYVLQRTTAECTAGLQGLLQEAQKAYTTAEAHLLDDGLSLMNDWMQTRDLFFSAGALFAAVGDAPTAARCFLHATFINRAFHNDDEALTTLAMSVDQLKQAHPQVAVESLLRLAPCYAKRQLRYQAARCYRDAAELMETELKDREGAVELYREALNIYADTAVAAKKLSRAWEKLQRAVPVSTPPSASTSLTNAVKTPQRNDAQLSSPATSMVSATAETNVTLTNMKAGLPPPHYQVSTAVQKSLIDGCRGRLLVLLTLLQRYADVLEVALTCAEDVPRTLPRTTYLLSATLSVLARGAALPAAEGDVAPNEQDTPTPTVSASAGPAFMSAAAEAADARYFDSLHDTAKIFSALQEEDRFFQRGKENELVRALLAANTACSLTMFDEAVRTYKGYTTTQPSVVHDLLLEQCRRSLYEHVERFS